MRKLLEREDRDPACRLAVEVYVYGVVKAIGALIAAASAASDCWCFPEESANMRRSIRARICDRVRIPRRADRRGRATLRTPPSSRHPEAEWTCA